MLAIRAEFANFGDAIQDHSQLEIYLETKDYALSGEEFCLKHDAELDMLITEPRPDELSRYYQSPDYISHTDASKTSSDRLYHLVKRFMLRKKVRLMERYTGGPGSVLDVGSGTGDFLLTAKRRNWTVAGVEPNLRAQQLAEEKQLHLYPDIEHVAGERFDAITLWHVLEHLPDLSNSIQTFKNHLKPDGIILVAVPNYRSLDAALYGKYWAAYDVPRHLWHFSQTAIRRLFEGEGFLVERSFPLIFDAFYVALLSERYKTGKTRYVRAFWNGLRSNLAAWRTSEYSSLLYVIKKA